MRKFYQGKSELYRGRATPLTSPQRVQHPYGGTAQRLPPPPGFRPLPGQRQRKEEGGPFDKHPEVSARLAHAGAERSECHRPARAGRRLSCSSQKRFRNLSYVSKPARMCRFCAEAFFSFGPGAARFLFGKIEKKMGGALLRPTPHPPPWPWHPQRKRGASAPQERIFISPPAASPRQKSPSRWQPAPPAPGSHWE